MDNIFYRIHYWDGNANKYEVSLDYQLSEDIIKIQSEGHHIVDVGIYSTRTGKTTYNDIARFILAEK